MSNFYRCTTESLQTGCITVWYCNCSSSDQKLFREWREHLSSSQDTNSQPHRTAWERAAASSGTALTLLTPCCYYTVVWQTLTIHPDWRTAFLFKPSDCLPASCPSSRSATLYYRHFITATWTLRRLFLTQVYLLLLILLVFIVFITALLYLFI